MQSTLGLCCKPSDTRLNLLWKVRGVSDPSKYLKQFTFNMRWPSQSAHLEKSAWVKMILQGQLWTMSFHGNCHRWRLSNIINDVKAFPHHIRYGEVRCENKNCFTYTKIVKLRKLGKTICWNTRFVVAMECLGYCDHLHAMQCLWGRYVCFLKLTMLNVLNLFAELKGSYGKELLLIRPTKSWCIGSTVSDSHSV